MGTIEEFRIAILQADLDDLREWLARTRWPDQLPGADREPEVYRRYHHWWGKLPGAETRLLPG
jgi:hypothetical protein